MNPETDNTAPNSLDAWKKAAVHEVTLPSNTKVKIKLPDLPALLKAGEIPNPLVEVALNFSGNAPRITPDVISSQVDFTRFLIAKTVVEPAVTADDVSGLPYEDQEMLMEFATRQRDLDATGRHIGGVEVVDDFNSFRSQ